MERLDAVRQTIRMDTLSGGPPDGRWMTLAELAAARGTSKATASRLVRRNRWRRQPGNDGHVRVYVPEGKDEPRADGPAGALQDVQTGALVVIQAALSAQERAESRAESAEQRASRAEARAEALATELAEARARADIMAASLTHLEAELARRKRGLLARIRGVWRPTETAA